MLHVQLQWTCLFLLSNEGFPEMHILLMQFCVQQSLTEGIHSKEALELVKEHVRAIMGPASMGFSNSPVIISRLQAAQVCLNLGRAGPLQAMHWLILLLK